MCLKRAVCQYNVMKSNNFSHITLKRLIPNLSLHKRP